MKQTERVSATVQRMNACLGNLTFMSSAIMQFDRHPISQDQKSPRNALYSVRSHPKSTLISIKMASLTTSAAARSVTFC
jgi:hypothetical protein